MKARGVHSVYRLCQLLGKSSISHTTMYKRKLTGQKRMKYKELVKICSVISKKTGQPLSPEDIKWRPDTIIVE